MPSFARNSKVLASACAVGALVVTAPAAEAAPLALPVACEATSQDSTGSVNPDNPDQIDFEGSGELLCVDAGGSLLLTGHGEFSGTFPRAGAPEGTKAIYRATISWSDGKKSTGTFTNFHRSDVAGSGVVTISGPIDATSTRFAGYTATVTGASLDLGGTENTQATVVTYTP